jgi:hypothetical protein
MVVPPKRRAKAIKTYINTGCGRELSGRVVTLTVVKTLVTALLVAALLAAVVAATEVETAVSVVLSLLTAVVVVRGNSKLLLTHVTLGQENTWSSQGGLLNLDLRNKVLLGAVKPMMFTTI